MIKYQHNKKSKAKAKAAHKLGVGLTRRIWIVC